MNTLEVVTIILYAIVGVMSLIMALKSLLSKKFIKFQEEAAAKQWEEIEKPLQFVILALIRISGLGFLVIALLLLIFPIINYFRHDNFIKFSIPLVSSIFCLGLFLINYFLHKNTKSETPYRGSLIALTGILSGIILSFFF
jgi:hypothetical protein